MKTQELRKKSSEELHKMLSSKREDLRKFRFNISGSRAKNVKEGRNIHKDIARVQTIFNENTNK